jgi:hypothetical protein
MVMMEIDANQTFLDIIGVLDRHLASGLGTATGADDVVTALARALRPRLGFAGAPSGWCTHDHSRDSILVPDGRSFVADYGHHDGAVTAAHVAFQMKNLLPAT